MPIAKKSPRHNGINQLAAEEEAKLYDDREFWASCVSWLICEETIDPERAIKIADKLTEARRQRFPLPGFLPTNIIDTN